MIIIVTRNFPPDLGGIQSLTLGIANSLAKQMQVHVIAPKHKKSCDQNTPFHVYRIFKMFFKFGAKKKIDSILSKHKANCDALIFDHWKSMELLPAHDKQNTICLVHGKEINHKKNSRAHNRMSKALAKAKYIVANSEFTKNLLEDTFGNITVIPPGIEKIKCDDSNLITGTPKFITVARLDKRKNHANVIKCIHKLKSQFPDIIYTCVGSGAEQKTLQAMVRQLSLEANVRFITDCNDEVKFKLLRSSDVHIMPSGLDGRSVEGFGISFIEAANLGIPSIGGIQGGASDAIADGKTGLLCDGDNVESVYNAMFEILQDNKYKIYGKNAKQFSKSFYWDVISKKYLDLLQLCCPKSKITP